MKLIIGLGNPGKTYEHTRHNVGFEFLDFIKKESLSSLSGEITHEKKNETFELVTTYIHLLDGTREKLFFLKPFRYMNRSGEVVAEVLNILPSSLSVRDDLWVFHDEYALSLGTVKIDRNKSSAGHHGVQNIIDHLHSKDFVRFRIGIAGKEQTQDTLERFVLKKFSKTEQSILQHVKEDFFHFFYTALCQGIPAAQLLAHTK